MDIEDEQKGAPGAFTIVEHTADWAVRVRGRDLPALLLNAARAMNSLLVANVAEVPVQEEQRLTVDAFDRESMLVEWLSELAFLAERDGFIGREFALEKVSPELVVATVRGGRAPELQKHIKAVTYHNLEVVESADGLEATVVFDV